MPKFLRGDRDLQIPSGASGRLQLAEWLTSPRNPLTARVMVNRLWQWHFGKGLVATCIGRCGSLRRTSATRLMPPPAEKF